MMARSLALAFTALWVAAAGAVTREAEPEPASLPAGWTRLADLPRGVAKFGTAAHAGRIYVVGGYDTRRTVYVYDIAANAWSHGPPLPLGSDNLAALVAGNRLRALGGEAGKAHQVLDSVHWSIGPALPGVRFAAAAAVLADRVHLVGGWNANNAASASLSSHDVFDPLAGTWAAAAPLQTARNAAGAAALGDRLYVVGGRAPGIRRTDWAVVPEMEVYLPGADRWIPGPRLPTARAGLAVVAWRGRLYALGGETGPDAVSNAVERFDPASQQWMSLPGMPFAGHGLGAVAAGDSIYVMGGFTAPSDAVGSESAALYRYRPAD